MQVETAKEALLPLKKAYEAINDKILQTSKTYQGIIQEVHEVAEKLVDSIRKHEVFLVNKASEMSVLGLRELEEKKGAITTQIEEIQNLLTYNENLESEKERETNVEDRNEWESAIKAKMEELCEIKDWSVQSQDGSIEFKSLFVDPQLMVAFCHYGEISTSYEIKDEDDKQNIATGNLIDFDQNENIINDSYNQSHQESETSFEAIPYL